jgi:hypothetical protein
MRGLDPRIPLRDALSATTPRVDVALFSDAQIATQTRHYASGPMEKVSLQIYCAWKNILEPFLLYRFDLRALSPEAPLQIFV